MLVLWHLQVMCGLEKKLWEQGKLELGTIACSDEMTINYLADSEPGPS
jgi:hypothetical protein